MNTVIELMRSSAKEHGGRPFLADKTDEGWKKISFEEAHHLSSSLAASLISLGLMPLDNVGLYSEGRATWAISEFAILKAGLVSVPLSTKLSGEEIVFRLYHSGAKAFLVSENTLEKACEALAAIKSAIPLICISPKNAKISEIAERFSLKEGEGFYLYENLVKEGERLLKEEGYEDKLKELEKDIHGDSLATICYTSGTVGNPKGVMTTHKNYLHNMDSTLAIVDLKAGWRCLMILPVDHIFGHTAGMYIFLKAGVALYFVDSRGGAVAALRNIPLNLKEVNPDVLISVPAITGSFMKKMFQVVREKGRFVNGIFERGLKAAIKVYGNGFDKVSPWEKVKNLPAFLLAKITVFPKLKGVFGKKLKWTFVGGALLELKQQDFYNAIGIPLYQGYGLTEHSPIISGNCPRKHKFGTAGAVLPNCEVKIVKQNKQESGAGETGHILVRSDSTMRGYYKNPDATKEVLIDGWLWTGDLGVRDRDGFLSVTGREKAILIAASGEKYSPEVVEEAIASSSRFINQVMVYNEQSTFTSALITLNTEELKAHLEELRVENNPRKVIEIIKEDLNAFKDHSEYKHIPSVWRPMGFAVLPKPMSEETGVINSTLKLVRRKAKEYYAAYLREIYGEAHPNPYMEGNIRALMEAKVFE